MKISFTPIRYDADISLEKQGDTLFINDEEFDFSPLNEGDSLPREAIDSIWFASDVERIDGAVCLTLLLPHGQNAPEETLFPADINADTDGNIPVPPYCAEEDE